MWWGRFANKYSRMGSVMSVWVVYEEHWVEARECLPSLDFLNFLEMRRPSACSLVLTYSYFEPLFYRFALVDESTVFKNGVEFTLAHSFFLAVFLGIFELIFIDLIFVLLHHLRPHTSFWHNTLSLLPWFLSLWMFIFAVFFAYKWKLRILFFTSSGSSSARPHCDLLASSLSACVVTLLRLFNHQFILFFLFSIQYWIILPSFCKWRNSGRVLELARYHL